MPCRAQTAARRAMAAGHAEQVMRDDAQRALAHRVRRAARGRSRTSLASMSQSTGVRPAWTTAAATEKQVNAGMTTSRPRRQRLERRQRDHQRRRARRQREDVADVELAAEVVLEGADRAPAGDRPGEPVPRVDPGERRRRRRQRPADSHAATPRTGRVRVGRHQATRAVVPARAARRGPASTVWIVSKRIRRSSQADMCLM